MCKDNTIITSWSKAGAYTGLLILFAGIFATWMGAQLTWGQICIIPAVLAFFPNKKHYYHFTNSDLTIEWFLFKRTVTEEEIQRVNFFETKSGTWIVVELCGAPGIISWAGRKGLIAYCLRNHRKSYLIPLQWGERDKALKILRECYPDKIVLQT